MTDEQALADLDRIAKWSTHRASRTTRAWLEPAIANVRAALTDNESEAFDPQSGPFIHRKTVRATAADSGRLRGTPDDRGERE